ncbi:MAG: right-handed parallel beta-helix repeat-containing protein, partial [Promethearchaeota archaeon]
MKSNAKSKLIIIGILFTLLPIITTNFSYGIGNKNRSLDYSDDFILKKDNLKVSAVSGRIHIDDTNPSYNWSVAKDAGICTGNGTYSEPYIIKDLIIDGGGSGTCILIEDSDVYFTIQNCTLFNSGNTGSRTSGIYLKNVSNGQIINNNCSFNKNGIHTYFSKNNTILGNIANNNSRYGIWLDSQCNDTKIDKNTACFNSEYGIYVDGGYYIYHHSYNLLIINNDVSYNAAEGIRVVFTNDSQIIGNSAINVGIPPWGGCALNIQLCQNITISSNRLQGSNAFGIEAWNLKLINIYNNTISSNQGPGLDIQNSNYVNIANNYISENNVGMILGGFYGDPQPPENCLISENFISDCVIGIQIGNIFNMTIRGNNMQNCGILISGHSSIYHSTSHTIDTTNLVNGKPVYYYVNQTNLEINDLSNVGQIMLVNCNHSLLSNLNIYSSSAGILLLHSNKNEISGCILNKNLIGLYLSNSHNNTVSGLETNSNDYGMLLDESHFNIIINSKAYSNYAGLALTESNGNQISGNNIHHSTVAGIHLFYSNFNLITQNKMHI